MASWQMVRTPHMQSGLDCQAHELSVSKKKGHTVHILRVTRERRREHHQGHEWVRMSSMDNMQSTIVCKS